MKVTDFDKEILNRLVGKMGDGTSDAIKQNIDCFLHPEVSLFIPASGQCQYAVSPNHSHPAYSFIYYFQPVSELIVEGNCISYDFTNGKCLSVMSPDIPHQEIEQDHFESYIAILIDAGLFQKTMLQYKQQVPVYHGDNFLPHPELLGTLRCFMLETGESNRNRELLDHLAVLIAHLVVRSLMRETKKSIHLYDRFEIDKAIAYMNNHFSEKITIEDLSKQVNLSTGHFSKVFKSVTGTTPVELLHEMRMKKARGMLMNSNKNITEIALECGFHTSSYFSSCFLEKYQMTPSAFRQTFQKTT